MILRDLIPVTDTFRIIMTERNTQTIMRILSDDPLVKLEMLDLQVIEVYPDCGLNVVVKFNKDFYRWNKKLFK